MMCCCRRRCCCRQPPHALRPLLLLPLVLLPPLAAAAAGPNRCDTIYQGFAECLIRLGDGMGHGGELETICSTVDKEYLIVLREPGGWMS
ncbi:neuritin-like protein isoform X4 [Nomascus leucogenys]|uniref:neuritin-like protein isoform X4 n=1 Tax=Nomascus leucogenys TaxID=61853 RepID=UPI00122D81D1|nr:neuritin-like protein isoform X4 [Nomascus leucogenys]XP_032003216.1 neuritin-like protein isoform X4 [Hylobates moloch]